MGDVTVIACIKHLYKSNFRNVDLSTMIMHVLTLEVGCTRKVESVK